MNTITSGVKNWKTTLVGVVVAVLLVVQSKDITNWQEWVVPALIAALGALSRDANISSEKSGIKVLVAILALSPFFLISCAPSTYEVNTQPYAQQIKEHPEKVTMSQEDVKPINKLNIDASVSSQIYGISAKYDPQGGFATDIDIDTILSKVDQTSGK